MGASVRPLAWGVRRIARMGAAGTPPPRSTLRGRVLVYLPAEDDPAARVLTARTGAADSRSRFAAALSGPGGPFSR